MEQANPRYLAKHRDELFEKVHRAIVMSFTDQVPSLQVCDELKESRRLVA